MSALYAVVAEDDAGSDVRMFTAYDAALTHAGATLRRLLDDESVAPPYPDIVADVRAALAHENVCAALDLWNCAAARLVTLRRSRGDGQPAEILEP